MVPSTSKQSARMRVRSSAMVWRRREKAERRAGPCGPALQLKSRSAAVVVGVAGNSALDTMPGGARRAFSFFPVQARFAFGPLVFGAQLRFIGIEALAG